MTKYILSKTAENLIPSEIRKISGAIDERKEKGEKIFNFTIGDFSSDIFPIPNGLKEEIIKAYNENQTNYPPSDGVMLLRKSVCEYLRYYGGFNYTPEEILIGSGARPLTYSLFTTIVDAGDVVIYPAPSWNNNCYCQLVGAEPVSIETKPENNFVPTAKEIEPYIKNAVLIALNSPLNPSGTAFKKENIKDIVNLVVEENERRDKGKKPLYVFYDMVYWILSYNNIEHYNPVELNPRIRDYIVFVDGISKCFAATGVRVGWAFGPKQIINKMSAILAHIGAWAPKAEQIALAKYLQRKDDVNNYFKNFKEELFERLNIFYNEISELKNLGFNVDAIKPEGAMYLTVKFQLNRMKTEKGEQLETVDDVTKYILDEAKIAIVPFYAFGASKSSFWFRLSVGTCSIEEAKESCVALRNALTKLKK